MAALAAMKSWQSSMASRDESASSSSAAAVSDGGDPGFLEILSAQQQLFRQTEGVLNALVDKKPAEDGLVCFEPSTISSLKELFSNLKVFLQYLPFRKPVWDLKNAPSLSATKLLLTFPWILHSGLLFALPKQSY